MAGLPTSFTFILVYSIGGALLVLIAACIAVFVARSRRKPGAASTRAPGKQHDPEQPKISLKPLEAVVTTRASVDTTLSGAPADSPFGDRSVLNPLFRESFDGSAAVGSAPGRTPSAGSFAEIVTSEFKRVDTDVADRRKAADCSSGVVLEPPVPAQPPSQAELDAATPAMAAATPPGTAQETAELADPRAERLRKMKEARQKRKAEEWACLTEALSIIDDMKFDEC